MRWERDSTGVEICPLCSAPRRSSTIRPEAHTHLIPAPEARNALDYAADGEHRQTGIPCSQRSHRKTAITLRMVETPHHPEWEKLLSAAATRCGKTMVIIYLDPHRREMNKISFKMWVTKQVYEVILGAFAPPPNMSDADRDKLIDLLALGLTASDSEWAEHWAFTTAVQMLKEMGAED